MTINSECSKHKCTFNNEPFQKKSNPNRVGVGKGGFEVEKTPRIFIFATLPLDIPKKTKFHSGTSQN